MNQSPVGKGTRQLAAAGCLLVLVGAIVLLGWVALRAAWPMMMVMGTPTSAVVAVLPTSTPSPAATSFLATATVTSLPPTATATWPTPTRPAATVALSTATAPLPATAIALPVVPGVDSLPPPARAEQDYDRLLATILAPLDLLAVAEQLGGVTITQPTPTSVTYALGDQVTFYVEDSTRQAELKYFDDLAAYWVETGLAVDQTELAAAAERMRTQYYPLLLAYYGQEARPGIDGDPRWHVLHLAGTKGNSESGYFVASDQYPRALIATSNERQMVYLNMADMAVGDPLYDGTLIHEVQHLIQSNLDANEERWLDEGLSQVAETMAGLDTAIVDGYLELPSVRLDRLSTDPATVSAHYGGAHLFALYLWEQAGDAALSELVRHPANGLAAVRAVLAGYRPDLTLEQFSGDWAAALYLDGVSADPRYNMTHVTVPDWPYFYNSVAQLPFEMTNTLDQYAVDYISLRVGGPVVISFAGDATAALIDPPPNGGAFWFAPPNSNSHAQLTAAVDLSGVSAASLDFTVWHDLEKDYDFAYLSVSDDGGQTWNRLAPARPVDGLYGLAWGGESGGWRRESVQLDAYAGRPLLLRFDVLTDESGLGRGFALSDIWLNVAGQAYPPVWQANGFVETSWLLPQRWEVRVIRDGQTPEVIPLVLDESNRGQLAVDLGAKGGALVVMPVTSLSFDQAGYWLRVSR